MIRRFITGLLCALLAGGVVQAQDGPIAKAALGVANGRLPVSPTAVVVDEGTSTIQAALPQAANMDQPPAVVGIGDSVTFGYGLVAPNVPYFNIFCDYYGWSCTNSGASNTLANTPYQQFTANALTQAPLNNRLTTWLAGYNDERGGASASRLQAFQGWFYTDALTRLSRLSNLRQYYGSDFGSANTIALTGSWGISPYGNSTGTARWRGVTATTNGNSYTTTVYGDVVYVDYDTWQSTTTGGLFSVAIDGVTVATSVSGNGSSYVEGLPSATSIPTIFPQVLRFQLAASGAHTVVITDTSATGANNEVGIEFVTSNGIGGGLSVGGLGAPRLVAAGPQRMNSAAVAADGVYASKAVADAAVSQYRQVEQNVIEQLASDGFNAAYVNVDDTFDPSVSGAMQADNIHPSANPAGAPAIAAAFARYFNGRSLFGYPAVPARRGYGSLPLSLSIGSSPAVVQNTTRSPETLMLSGGTITAVSFSRDCINYIGLGTPSSVDLSPNDCAQVTYSAAPTVYAVGR